MSPITTMLSNNTEVWNDKDLSAADTVTEENGFSDELDADFLLMDDGLEIDDDDFDGLLDIDSSLVFDPENINNSEESEEEDEIRNTSSLSKRSAADDNFRIESPPPKKARLSGAPSPTSVTAVASFPSPLSLAHERPKGPDKYQLALQHLALSMRRSEMTRNEIIRQRKEAEIKAKLAAAQVKTVSNAESFLFGNRITLTKGLEQSRQMLQSFMSGAKTLP